MANILAKLSRKTLVVTGLGALAALVLAVMVTGAGGAPEVSATERQAVVKAEPFKVVRTFAGQIVAGDQAEMVFHADARIKSLNFAYGDKVEAGQLLVELDSSDIHRARSEAMMGVMRAQNDAARYAEWDRGPEMQRAMRAVENARYDLDETQRRTVDAERLYDRGLISRSEHESQQSQLRQRQQALLVAEEELARSTRTKNSSEARIARIQADLAQRDWQSSATGSSTEIRAQRAGVIVRPSRGGGGEDASLHAGTRVSRGQVFAVVAALDGLDVAFKLNEADLATINSGMGASVRGSGFAGHELAGVLQTVAGEAISSSSGKAEFEARVRLNPLDEAVQKLIRVGMTAQISLVLYENPNALTLPIEAVKSLGQHGTVTVLDNGTRKERIIQLGKASPDRVEVLSGLKAGDTVVWTP